MVAICPHVPKFRRGACRTCYRKLGGAGLPIGPDQRADAAIVRGLRNAAARLIGSSQARLDALVDRMPDDALARLRAALAKARGE